MLTAFWFSSDKTTSCAWKNPKYLYTCNIEVNNLITYKELMRLYETEFKYMDCNTIREELIKKGYEGMLFDSELNGDIKDGYTFTTARGSKHIIRIEDNYYCDYLIDKWGNEEFQSDHETIESLKSFYTTTLIVFEAKNIKIDKVENNKYWNN